MFGPRHKTSDMRSTVHAVVDALPLLSLIYIQLSTTRSQDHGRYRAVCLRSTITRKRSERSLVEPSPPTSESERRGPRCPSPGSQHANVGPWPTTHVLPLRAWLTSAASRLSLRCSMHPAMLEAVGGRRHCPRPSATALQACCAASLPSKHCAAGLQRLPGRAPVCCISLTSDGIRADLPLDSRLERSSWSQRRGDQGPPHTAKRTARGPDCSFGRLSEVPGKTRKREAQVPGISSARHAMITSCGLQV